MQVQQSFAAFEKKYARPFETLSVPGRAKVEEAGKRMAAANTTTGALYLEGLLVCACGHRDPTVSKGIAEEQVRKLASEQVDRARVHPALLVKAESLVQ